MLTGPLEVTSGERIELVALNASDPDGDTITSYTWQQESEPHQTLGVTAEPTFQVELGTVSAETTVIFELVVSDGELDSQPAMHEVIVHPKGGCIASGATFDTTWALFLLIFSRGCWRRARRDRSARPSAA